MGKKNEITVGLAFTGSFCTYDKMKEVAVWSDGYLDMTPYNNEFIYVDGVHLHKVSGEIVTRKIAEWLKTKIGFLKMILSPVLIDSQRKYLTIS